MAQKLANSTPVDVDLYGFLRTQLSESLGALTPSGPHNV
jgi:hypothetical protein